ncbi:MAG: translation initiation factor IF-2 subunit beta [archaeon]
MKYEDMLKRAKKNLPDVVNRSERFEMPKVKGRVEGNKTIVVNFFQIADALNRKPEQLLKYLQGELATPGHFEEKRLVFGRKLSSLMINEKIKKYAEDFVLCDKCGKPDTQLMDENGGLIKKCLACGTKTNVKGRI